MPRNKETASSCLDAIEGVVNIQTESREDVLSRHIKIMNELGAEQAQIVQTLQSGDFSAKNIIALEEVTRKEIKEMVGGLVLRRSLILFRSFTFSLPPARTY